MGGPKGSSKNMTVGKHGKEKLDLIKGENFQMVNSFYLAAVSSPPPGNMVELESFKPWLGKVVEVVQETKLEFGLVWWWERETQ